MFEARPRQITAIIEGDRVVAMRIDDETYASVEALAAVPRMAAWACLALASMVLVGMSVSLVERLVFAVPLSLLAALAWWRSRLPLRLQLRPPGQSGS